MAPESKGQDGTASANPVLAAQLAPPLDTGLAWQLAAIETYWGFLAFSLVYSLIYAPTLALTNSLSFHHLPDRDRDFGKVRLWGTVGWIAAGIGIGQWLLHQHTPAGVSAEVAR